MDRMHYAAAGATELSFFSQARGQSATLITAGAAAAKSKSYRDTNMESSNVVPTKLFKFLGISIAFVHEDEGEIANPTDRDKIRNGAYLQFRIVDKDILIIPLLCIPELNPNVIGGTTKNDSTILGAAGGGGYGVPMYRLGIPITLNPYENFSVAIKLDGTVTTTKAVDIYVIMQGFMRRPT